MNREQNCFGIFDKYYESDNYIYLPLFLNDSSADKSAIFDFFFSEDALYNHFKKNNDSLFERTPKCFSLLYRNLQKFIDEEIANIEYDLSDCSQNAVDILLKEQAFFGKDKKIRKDKTGKIGEYLASIILEKVFSYTCIIPKSDLITSKNMSVYGIDTLHYDYGQNTILFGESKFTSNLKNGVWLISESLDKYEKRINDEIELIFTQRLYDSLNIPKEIFKDAIDSFIDVKTFIAKTEIKEIYVPLFIAHGEQTNPDEILIELKTIERNKFLGMNTKYLVISMPVENAKSFVEYFIIRIKAKIDEYESLLKDE